MIYYVGHPDFPIPMETYLRSRWSDGIRDRIKRVGYDTLRVNQELPTGTYIFSAVDHLTDAQKIVAAHFADRLGSDDRNAVLNHPTRTLGRFDLLRTLYERGINSYNVYRAHEIDQIERWPVFIRFETEHEGPRTPLISGREELEYLLIEALFTGIPRRELMICEYCDTSRDGAFRKFGAFNFAGKLVPRHVAFGSNWVTKVPNASGGAYPQAWVEEETRFLEALPDEAVIRQVFEIARIDYGRIDYGYRDGRIEVWEINTNPQPTTDHAMEISDRIPLTSAIAERLVAGYEKLLALSREGKMAVDLPSEVLCRASESAFASRMN